MGRSHDHCWTAATRSLRAFVGQGSHRLGGLWRWLAVLAVGFGGLLQPATSTPVYAAPDDTPVTVVDEGFFEWDIANGMLHWGYDCSWGGEFPNEGYLRRKPLYGGSQQTLSTQGNTAETCQASFRNLTTDATGLYYYNGIKGRLEFRPSASPTDPATIIAPLADPPVFITRLVVTDPFIYWISTTHKVMRIRKDGTELTTVATGATNAKDIMVLGNSVYWLDDGGLWVSDVSCGTLPCAKTNLVVTKGQGLLYVSGIGSSPLARFTYSIYWVETIGTQKIRRYTCNLIAAPCSTATVYTAPTDHPWILGRMARSGDLLFWPEIYYDTGGGKRLRRLDLTNTAAGPVNIAEEVAFSPIWYTYERVFADNLNVYFIQNGRISRLPLNATAIVHDLVADAMEVTQGIQNLANDTPLVAQKTTYVRAYLRQLTGPGAVNVAARLYGTRNGSPLPGSPLSSLNGSRFVTTGGSYNRANLNDGWLFQLPSSWISGGAVVLRVVVDPQNSYDDPNRANNELSRTLSFANKGPVCTLFVNVRTNAPSPSINNASFWPMIDYAKRLWPTRDYWVYRVNAKVEELEACWWGPFPYPCGGPFELPDDSWKVFLGLGTIDAFTDDPDACDDAGGSTHYVGMVHQSTNTGTTTGTGMTAVFNYSWVKFSTDAAVATTDPFVPRSGETLAHELGHNLGRKHVNCGSPDDPDGSYPYPNNQIDNSGAANHYGFDIKTRKPIAPTGAKDFMSYCTPKWTSDYTWKALFNRLAVANVNAAGANLATAASALLISGAVTPTVGTGYLNYGWNFPTAALSSKMMQKWQDLTGGAVSAAAAASGVTTNAGYHVRLLDADGAMLADNPVTPVAPHVHEGTADTLYFLTTFPAPGGTVAKVELLQDSTVLATLTPGANVPTVSMIKPAGGETIEDQLEVSWQASDADVNDILHYTVQYSPDNGVNWFSLLSDFVGPQDSNTVSVLIDSLSIPGSATNTARIRVAASDGYNTALALSQPFTVKNRKPEAHISAPAIGETAVAGQAALLRGGAIDAEEGTLSDTALSWTVAGKAVGTGEDVNVPGLAPGSYPVVLTAQDSLGATGTATATLTVMPLALPQVAAPTMDGFCDDESYGSGAQVALKPYGDGTQATVHLTRDGSGLWACFSGIKAGATTPGAFVGVRVDVNNSRDALAQSDDYGFFVKEDGGLFTYAGDGAGNFANAGPGGLQAQISTLPSGEWSAELRINADQLGGWNHLAGMNFGHYWVGFQGDDYHWPYDSGWNQPNLWATTALGAQPAIVTLSQSAATVGDAPFTLVVAGENFVDGAQVLWNGTALPTTFGSSTVVSATVAAPQLASAGLLPVVVRNPTNIDSAPAFFAVRNPQPTIATLSPTNTVAEAASFTLTVNGQNFVNGAKVFWNDQELPTTFTNSGQVSAQVDGAKLQQGQTANITVLNPDPDAQTSPAAAFVVAPKLVTTSTIYLPLVTK